MSQPQEQSVSQGNQVPQENPASPPQQQQMLPPAITQQQQPVDTAMTQTVNGEPQSSGASVPAIAQQPSGAEQQSGAEQPSDLPTEAQFLQQYGGNSQVSSQTSPQQLPTMDQWLEQEQKREADQFSSEHPIESWINNKEQGQTSGIFDQINSTADMAKNLLERGVGAKFNKYELSQDERQSILSLPNVEEFAKTFAINWVNDEHQMAYVTPQEASYISNIGQSPDYIPEKMNTHNAFMDGYVAPFLNDLGKYSTEGYNLLAHTIMDPVVGAYGIAKAEIMSPMATVQALSDTITGQQGSDLLMPLTFLTPADFAIMAGEHPPRTISRKMYEAYRAKANGLLDAGDNNGIPILNESKTPEVMEAMNEAAAKMAPQELADEMQKAQAPSLDAVARSINPDLMSRFEKLKYKRELAAQGLREATENRNDHVSSIISPFEERIKNASDRADKYRNAGNNKKADNASNELNGLLQQREDWFNEQIRQDTPELESARTHYLNLDGQFQSALPSIIDLYKEAREKLPAAETTFDFGENAEDILNQTEPEEGGEINIPPHLAPWSRPMEALASLESDKAEIERDVTQKLVNVGYTPEEAGVFAKAEAEHNGSMVEQGWTNMTAKELYDKYFPEVKKEKEKVPKTRTLSQSEREFGQKNRGKITFREGVPKAVITLMKIKDATTFLHENGHAWLEKLLDMARQPEASEGLKRHVAAVRKYLGMDESQLYPTRAQHERFTRGLERYFHTGEAPSPKLANVFEKLRGWFRAVYANARGRIAADIRTEMPPEIRGLYDRIISAPNHMPIISREGAAPEAAANLAVSELPKVTPETAGDVSDDADKNIEIAASQVNKKVKDAITAAETDTLNEQGTDTATVYRESGVSGTDATALQSAEGAAGGNANEANGGSVRSTENAGTEPESDGTGASAGKRAELDADRIGNLSLQYLTSDKELQKVITDAEKDKLDDLTHDVVTDRERDELARSAGIRAKELSMDKIKNISQMLGGDMHIGAAVRIVRDMAQNLAQRLWEIGTEMRAARESGDLEKYHAMSKELMDVSNKLHVILGHISDTANFGGSVLRAFSGMGPSMKNIRNMREFLQSSREWKPEDLDRYVDQIADSKDANEAARKNALSAKRSVWEKLDKYVQMNFLSGPLTHLGYATAPYVKTVADALIENGSARLGQIIRKSIWGEKIPEGERVHLAESAGSLHGMYYATTTAWEVMKQGYKEGRMIPLPGMTKEEAEKTYVFSKKEQVFRGFPEKTKDGETPVANIDKTSPPSFLEGGILHPAEKYQNKVLAAIHTFTSYFFHCDLQYKYAYRMALDKGLRFGTPEFTSRVAGLVGSKELLDKYGDRIKRETLGRNLQSTTGIKFDQDVTPSEFDKESVASKTSAYISKKLEKPSQSIKASVDRMFPPGSRKRAILDGLSTSVTDPATGFVKAVSQTGGELGKSAKMVAYSLENIPLIGKNLFAFSNFNLRIIKRTWIDQNPLMPLLSQSMRDDLSGKNGYNVAIDTTGRLITGVALMGLGAVLNAQGVYTGYGPTDKKERALWRAEGNRPFSLKIDGHLVPVEAIGWAVLPMLNAGAALRQAIHDGDENKANSITKQFLESNAHSIANETFVGGLSDLMNAINEGGNVAKRYLDNIAMNWVPASVGLGQIAHEVDPYYRETYPGAAGAGTGFEQTLQSHTPFLSRWLPPEYDMFGRKIQEAWLPKDKYKGDPVFQAINKLNYAPAPVPHTIDGVELTNEQYSTYAKLAGQRTYQELKNLFDNTDTLRVTPVEQLKRVRYAVKSAHTWARNMMKTDHELRAEINQLYHMNVNN